MVNMNTEDRELHRIVVTVLVYKPNFTYLITKRSLDKKMFPGKWHIPGGGVSMDDYINTPPSTDNFKQWYRALENTLRREIREEVTVEIGTPEFLVDYTFIQSNGIPALGLSYFAPYVSGEVTLNDESTEFAWITIDEVGNYDFIDGIEGEIKEIDEILKKRKLG